MKERNCSKGLWAVGEEAAWAMENAGLCLSSCVKGLSKPAWTWNKTDKLSGVEWSLPFSGSKWNTKVMHEMYCSHKLYDMSNKNVFHVMARQKLRIIQEGIEHWSKQFGSWKYWNGKENVVTWNMEGRDQKRKQPEKPYNLFCGWVKDAFDWPLLNFTFSIF